MSAVYHVLSNAPFTQNWTDTGLITVNDNWDNVPSIIGYRGDDLTVLIGIDPQTLLADGLSTPVNAIANQTNPNTLTTGGIAEFEITDPVVAFQGSMTADAPFLLLHLNTIGVQNVAIAYLLRDVDGSTDNAIQPVALQYRIGNTGDFTNIPTAFVADASSGPSLATLATPVTAVLPANANNQAQVQVRIITANAVGSDEWIGIDNINVTAVPIAPVIPNPNLTINTATFQGQAIFATSFIPTGAAGTVNGVQVPVGGLSGVTYDAANNRYYAISDDRSQVAPARFYTFTIDPTTSAVTFTNVTTIKDTSGNTFALNSLDPEGIALTRNGTVFISSEGEVRPDLGASRVTAPFIREFNLATGVEVRSLPVPAKFLTTLQDTNNNGIVDNGDIPTAGVRNNLAFESLTITPDQTTLFTASENALIQDGAATSTSAGTRTRILQYNLTTGLPEREYLYTTDAAPVPNPVTGAADNGLVDLLAVDNRGTLLALERSFAVGVGNSIRIYEVTVAGATDITSTNSLSSLTSEQFNAIQPARKRLLLNLNDLNLPNSDGNHPTGLDNIEGLAFGAPLADGRQSIVLVSDNNFGATQFTQILTLAAIVEPSIQITEYEYAGTNGEFVEFTNIGFAPVDLTGWSFDDNTRLAGSLSLSAFGTVQPNESVIVTEADAATFRTAWNLPATVKIIGGSTQNLGRADEINIYDASGFLSDRLTYNDETFAGTFRAQNVSASTVLPNLLNFDINPNWRGAVVGDAQGSVASSGGDIGNPGRYNQAVRATPAVTIIPSGTTDVTEGGATDNYLAVLATQPTANVNVAIAGTQVTTNPTSLTFTPANWNIAQAVTVTAIDDSLVESAHTGAIAHTVTSADPIYNGIAVPTLSVNITDNDFSALPRIDLSVSSNTASEANPTAITITATASAAVSGNQTVTLGVSGTGITAADYYLSRTTLTIADGQTSATATFTVSDDAIAEGAETAILTISNPSSGVVLGTTTSQNIAIANNNASFLTKVGGISSTNGAEIPAFDPASRRIFTVAGNTIEIFTLSSAGVPTLAGTLTPGFPVAANTRPAVPNSVAVRNGIVAVAYAIQDLTTNAELAGRVSFYEAATGTFLNSVAVGSLPDMLTFTPDGTRVLVANEAQPNSYRQANSVDPEGSVSIINIAGGVSGAAVIPVQTASFAGFDIATLRSQGVRISSPVTTAAQDIEPEYIAISPDGLTAAVTLQENNAIAIVNIATATVTRILPLGLKDFSKGLPTVTTYDFTNLPTLGTTATVNPTNAAQTTAGQEIKLGGFSGLFFEGYAANGNLRFITNTDRGPNGEPTNLIPTVAGNERPFALPNFQPQLVRFELNRTTGQVAITQQIGLTRADGSRLTGLPNTQVGAQGAAYTDEVPVDLFGNRLTNDALGADLEGIAIAANGTFWLVDEYRPAIYNFDPAGRLIDRFVPQGTAAAASQPAGTFGTEVIPAVYAQRRANRGFEAIAIEGNKLYAFIQSAIDNPDTTGDTTSRASSNLRILELDISTRTVTGEYLYVLEDITGAGTTRTDKIGDAASLGNGRFLVVERDDVGTNLSNKLVFEIDLKAATKISGNLVAGVNIAIAESQEVPPVTDTPATGSYNATLNGNVLTVSGTFSSLTSALRVVGTNPDVESNPASPAHLHAGALGANGGIIRSLTITDNGNGSGSFRGTFNLTNTEVQTTRNGGLYVNLHTVNNPSGELRGQVILNQTLEQLTLSDLAAAGVRAVTKREVINVAAIGYTGVEKLEGLALIDANTFALINDNDFGLQAATLTGNGTVPIANPETPIKLGIVEFNRSNGLDLSDRDVNGTTAGGGRINIQNQPVFGLYMPDAIASFSANGQTYYVTANEGDGRDYTGFSDETRVNNAAYILDPTIFPNAATLKLDANLGRLTVTNATGDTDGDGDFDQIVSFGARSFSIFDVNGNLVFDSGDQLERITAARVPTLFNSDGTAASFDTRSDNKGPEPEGVVIGTINNRVYAFVGIERVGDVIVYEVTNPLQPTLVQYINTPEDVGAEGLTFVSAADSPTGRPLVITASEVSNTIAVFEVNVPTRISDIQGAVHRSPLEGQVVTTRGIVTAIATNGFYLQDPTPDNNPATSEAIFVFTNSAPAALVTVGASLNVSGIVSEFRPASNPENLTTTQIGGTTANPLGITAIASLGTITPTVIGNGGRAIPTQSISPTPVIQTLQNIAVPALLSEIQEPNITPNTAATGNFTYRFNGNQVTIAGSYSGLTSDRTSINLNLGAARTFGTVLGDLTVTGTTVVGTTTNTNFTGTFTLTAAQLTEFQAGRAYVNVSSTNFPVGELRGQLGPSIELSASFDPTTSGLDFFESLEGMLVQINNPVAVSPTNDFGEIFVLADNGNGATGRTARGGIVATIGDFNPERIQIDDDLANIATNPNISVGGTLSTVQGVISYNFNNYEVQVTALPTVVSNPLTREVTPLVGTATQLTIAAFNVENLDPGDSLFPALAGQIVNNLRSPDIISLEEVQDNNGATNNGVVDATISYNTLISAIAAAGGPTYQFRQIDPVNNQDGGEPGGNIRVGFLFNPARVTFVDRAGGTSTNSTAIVNNNGNAETTFSPGRLQENNLTDGDAFGSSRKPLVGEFLFNGQQVIVIGNHLNSKGGDQPLSGPAQLPQVFSETQRLQQAQIINNFVDSVLAINPSANIVVLGDINDFEFSEPTNVLRGVPGGVGTPVLTSLLTTLPANERYTYNFQGNAQVLDQILVSNGLVSRLDGFDVLNINSEFFDQVSDHDPSVARFNIVNVPPTVANPIADQTAPEDSAFSLTFAANTFSDIGDALTYAAALENGNALPTWLTFNPATRNFSGTPANADVSIQNIRVVATDRSGASINDVFALTVANTNDAPIVANAIADQTATEDSAFSFTFAANAFSDVDAGDSLRFAATLENGNALPSWLTFNATTRTFSGTPTNADVSVFNIRVVATDNAGASANDVFALTVANTNDAPIVSNAIADQTAPEDSAFSFTFAANAFSDVDAGDSLRFAATLENGNALPSWLTFNATTRTFSGTPTNADVSVLNIRVVATDGSGASINDLFVLTVANTNDAPVLANAIADQVATQDTAFSLLLPTNTFTDIDAGDLLTLSATRTDGTALPTWLNFNPTTRTFSGTPSINDVGTLIVKTTATDRSNASVSDQFIIATAIKGVNGIIAATSGNDTLIAAIGTDFDGQNNLIFTGAGNDTVDLTQISTVVSSGNNRIILGSDQDRIFVNGGDRIYGSAGNDIFEAADSQGGNRISGGAGNDIFYLGFGDRALGDAGNDQFYVGVGGNNTIAGGAGNDQFWIVNAELPTAANTILDFQIGADVIGLNGATSLGISFSTLTLRQVGANTAIAFNGQTLATLNGIQATNLTPVSFSFT